MEQASLDSKIYSVWRLFETESRLDTIDLGILCLLSSKADDIAFTVKQISRSLKLHKNTIRLHCKQLAKLKYIQIRKIGNLDVFMMDYADFTERSNKFLEYMEQKGQKHLEKNEEKLKKIKFPKVNVDDEVSGYYVS